MTESWDDALDAVGVLVDAVRRSMYLFVRAEGRPVSREEVAEATGTSVKLAAFHLDKLLDAGWLRSTYGASSRHPAGGRPPKLYEPTDRQVELSLPARRYDLMAEILLEGSGAEAGAITEDTRRAAHDRGFAAAERFRAARSRRRLGAERTMAAVSEVLADLGFEPRRRGPGELILANCPFRSLAQTSPGTVCEANLALVEGLLAGLRGSGVEAALDRGADRCCVVLRRCSS